MRRIDWGFVFQKEAPKLKGLCRRYVADAAIADDLVQETFITAIEKIELYKGTGSFEGWIRRIAINKALQYIKEHQNKYLSLDTMRDAANEQQESVFSPNKFRRAIEQASYSIDELLLVLDNLPLHHKTVFNLYVLDGYKHHEIAEMLNISTGTSKSHLSRARKKAQELLYEHAKQETTGDRRKRRGFVFLLFAPRSIDRIFQKGFKAYQLHPESFNFSATNSSLIKGGFTIGKALICGVIVSTSITGALVFHKANKKEPLALTNSTIIVEQPNVTAIVSTDSIKCDSIVEGTKEMEKAEIKNAQPKTPVVIRKKIIVHDTIRLIRPVSK